MQPGRRNAPAPHELRTLEEVAAYAADCSLCRLCAHRTHVVFGAGNPDADVMFVCEGPGYHDDRSGEPMSGTAGEVFDGLLREVGLSREDVYVTTVVKCRPPRNRTPFPDEVEQCEGYLFRQVTFVQPKVIVAFGNLPIRLLTGRPHTLSRIHGQPQRAVVQGREVVVYPLFHPAAASVAEPLLAQLRADMRKLPAVLRGEHAAPAVVRQPRTPVPADVAHALAAANLDVPEPLPVPEVAEVEPATVEPGDAIDQLTMDIG